MFVVEIGAVVTSFFLVRDLLKHGPAAGFDFAIAAWLWFTVLFANFAEAVAEGRGKAQADFLRRTKSDTMANKLDESGNVTQVVASTLRRGDRVRVEAGELIPADGDVVEGAATVDESAITGESAPVIRESGGDRSSVTGATRVLSDSIVVRVTANPGESFLDRMILLVEGAQRQKTPNEIALSILLSGLTIIFLIAVATLLPFSIYAHQRQTLTVLIALLVCLIPTTIGGLLSAIGNSRHGPRHAAERPGDERTGGRSGRRRGHAATRQDRHDHAGQPSGRRDHFGGGRRCERLRPDGVHVVARRRDARGTFDRRTCRSGRRPREFTRRRHVRAVQRLHAHERLGPQRRHCDSQGAPDSVTAWVRTLGGSPSAELAQHVERIARGGGTPLLLARNETILGVIYLKDILKPNMHERFDRLRAMGIRTIMITGDNP